MTKQERLVEVVRNMYGDGSESGIFANLHCDQCHRPKISMCTKPCSHEIAAYLIEQDEKAGARCQKS